MKIKINSIILASTLLAIMLMGAASVNAQINSPLSTPTVSPTSTTNDTGTGGLFSSPLTSPTNNTINNGTTGGTGTGTGTGVITPGAPNTGVGGDMTLNLMLLLASGVIAVGGITYLIRSFYVRPD